MSTTSSTSTTPEVMAAGAPDHRLALLTARTALEPELARRFAADPAAVRLEFGLPEEGTRGSRPREAGRRVLVERLDSADMWAGVCATTADAAPYRATARR